MVDVVFVGHEAQRSGAPIALLNLLRWLRRTSDVSFSVVLGAEGPLVEDFEELAHVAFVDDGGLDQLSQARLVYANSTWGNPLLDRAPGFEAPVISHVHELRSLLRQVDPEHAGKRPHRYIAVSDQVRDTLVSDYSIEPHEISVCKAFVPVSEIAALGRTDARSDWAQFGLPAHARVVGAVGALWPTKGTDLFVDMAANLIEENRHTAHDVHFVWIGGPPALIPMVQRQIDQRDLGHRVHLLGEFSRPFQLMGSLDVFVLPSREEAFSLVVLEAGVLGRSVVAFDCGGGVRELLADGRGVLVAPEDVVSMSRQVTALLDDAGRRQRLGVALERYVGDRHDVAHRAPDILRVIESAL